MPEELWFDEYHAQLLRDTYDQMVLVWYEIEEEDEENEMNRVADNDIDIHFHQKTEDNMDKNKLTVHIDCKSVREIVVAFGLNVDQYNMIEACIG